MQHIVSPITNGIDASLASTHQCFFQSILFMYQHVISVAYITSCLITFILRLCDLSIIKTSDVLYSCIDNI